MYFSFLFLFLVFVSFFGALLRISCLLAIWLAEIYRLFSTWNSREDVNSLCVCVCECYKWVCVKKKINEHGISHNNTPFQTFPHSKIYLINTKLIFFPNSNKHITTNHKKNNLCTSKNRPRTVSQTMNNRYTNSTHRKLTAACLSYACVRSYSTQSYLHWRWSTTSRERRSTTYYRHVYLMSAVTITLSSGALLLIIIACF